MIPENLTHRHLTAQSPSRRITTAPGIMDRARLVTPPPDINPTEKEEVRQKLAIMCKWLEQRLHKPLRLRRGRSQRYSVDVFECVSYRVNPDACRVEVGERRNGRFHRQRIKFEIGRPLSTPRWLGFVINHLGLYRDDPEDLFSSKSLPHFAHEWIEETAYRLLLRSPEFQVLRAEHLPASLGLPQDLLRIARAARTRPHGPWLDSAVFNPVWKNARAFRHVAQENPRLLPLLLALCDTLPAETTIHVKDPVLAIKIAFRDAGRSEAAWRYVTRHGARMFKPVWAISPRQSPFESAERYLHALEVAGLPPPPPPAVLNAWLHAYSPHHGDIITVEDDLYSKPHHRVLGAALREADRQRRDPVLGRFIDTFLGVMFWGETPDLCPDRNQIAAGWRWCLRQTLEFEKRCAATAMDNTPWSMRLAPRVVGNICVVPLNSQRALFQEAEAMRNCLPNYGEDCKIGRREIYSLRDAQSGKRIACVGFIFKSGVDIFDLKGFANTPAPGAAWRVAQILLSELQQAL